ncbi:MAG: hypothetical protein WCY41_04145 [Candidatus Micrarchaeia archaeon]
MATHPAKEKQPAHSAEKGVCIICGKACSGTPASPGFPVRAARKLRALLRLPPSHTIACSRHLAEAREKRARFEKRQLHYGLGAIAFFALFIFGSIHFGRAELGLFAPALLGALLVAVFPYFYYFPKFGK